MFETSRESGWSCWWDDATARDWRNLRRLMAAVAAWALSFAGGAYLLRGGFVGTGAIRWVVAVLPMVLGLLSLLAYGRYLRDADELQQMMHLRALALGFGGGWLAVAGYRLFELLGAPPIDRGDVTMIMAGVYTVGLLLGRRRYA